MPIAVINVESRLPWLRDSFGGWYFCGMGVSPMVAVRRDVLALIREILQERSDISG